MLVDENGPWDIFEKMRTAAGIKPGEITSFFGLLLSCIYCTTVWTTLFMTGIWYLEPVAVMICAAMAVALMPEVINDEKR